MNLQSSMDDLLVSIKKTLKDRNTLSADTRTKQSLRQGEIKVDRRRTPRKIGHSEKKFNRSAEAVG